jgi:hypothetical protein
MTIHRIGKNPKTAPSLPASAAWPSGIAYTAAAIAIATARDTTDAIQARTRNTPSMTNSAASGKAAASELHAREWATGLRIWRYMLAPSGRAGLGCISIAG